MRPRTLGLLPWLVLAAGGFARAQATDPGATVEALGSAPAADAATARTRALDDAFAQAVDQLIGRLVPAAERPKVAPAARAKILGRARGLVRGFRVRSEGAEGGVYHVHIDATVDVAALRVALGELGVVFPAAPAGPPPPPPRPRVVVLTVLGAGESAQASFGATPASSPVFAALDAAVRAGGFETVPAATEAPPVATEAPPPGLPLTLAQAAEIARRAGAGAALVVAVRPAVAGRIRGTRQTGATADAVGVAVDATTESVDVVGRAAEAAATFAATVDESTAAAALESAAGLGPRLAGLLAQRWPAVAGGVSVRVRGVARWTDVAAVVAAAAAVPGLARFLPASLSAGEVVFHGEGAAAAALAAAIVAAVPGVAAEAVDATLVTVDLAAPALVPAPGTEMRP